jgi:Transposase DDE domain
MLLLACDRFQSGGAILSDTYRRYRAIKQAIMQFYQPRPTGHREKHLNTLVALICGLAGGKHAHLPTIADHAPSFGARQESLIKRFRRFLQRDTHTLDGWFLPVAQQLLHSLAHAPIYLVMDGSVVGRGCLALMVSVVYHGRALPLCWLVVSAPKGHFSQDTHCALLAQVQQIMPKDAKVIFLGDGEFDGVQLQADLRRFGWQYVCRTASTILLRAYGVTFHVGDLGPPRGDLLAVSPAWMTAEQYGPISILALWEEQYTEPLYLVTNMSDLDEAIAQYKKRGHIETFFSDQKSRGFQIQKSHLSAPARVSRLLIASCLAYLWIVYLGVCAISAEWMKQLHRQDRCDLSLFRLGLRLLARALKEHIPIPDGLLVPAVLPSSLIRVFNKKAA